MIKYSNNFFGKHYKNDFLEINNNHAVVRFLSNLIRNKNQLYINPILERILYNDIYFPTGIFRVFDDFQQMKDLIENDCAFGKWDYEEISLNRFCVTSRKEKREYGGLIDEYFKDHAFFKYKGAYFFLEELTRLGWWIN